MIKVYNHPFHLVFQDIWMYVFSFWRKRQLQLSKQTRSDHKRLGWHHCLEPCGFNLMSVYVNVKPDAFPTVLSVLLCRPESSKCLALTKLRIRGFAWTKPTGGLSWLLLLLISIGLMSFISWVNLLLGCKMTGFGDYNLTWGGRYVMLTIAETSKI